MRAQSGRSIPNHMELLAIRVFSWIVEDATRISRFLWETGVDAADLRQTAHDPAFLAAVLDHVTADPALLEACAEATGIAAPDIDRARLALGGGAWEADTA